MSRAPHHAVSALKAVVDQLDKHMSGSMANNPSARSMRAQIDRLRTGVEALDRVRANRSPMDTPEAHTKKVATMARKLDTEITAAINRAGAALREGSEAVQRRISEKVNLKADAFAAEIRATYRNLSAKDQAKLIEKLIAENNGPELAALVKAPTLLTGMHENERAAYEQGIVARHAAPELEERSKLTEIFDAVCDASTTARNVTTMFTDPAVLARIEAGEAAARAAGDAFDQALSGDGNGA